MQVTYNRLLKGYIVEVRRRGSRSMIAVKRTRLEAIKAGLERYVLLSLS